MRAVAGAPGLAGAQAVSGTVTGILGYARWPQADGPLRLCILGPVEYGQVLAGIREQRLPDGRPIVARNLPLDTPNLPSHCDAVYTGRLDPDEEWRLYERLAGHAVLSIAEGGECEAGPMFCLHVQGSMVSFLVNLDSVARSTVRVHPQVLKLGRSRQERP
ncbi:YfiR family protein [Orrella sp. JC864]|uniref:YfiR family protein n=1 Tax=Orrella sp. JC864 TaxID=3120298 RepID=UPI00300A8556